jgi:tRNA pseudouridine32 synthase / 23S rRNA pseudouridine746 synthase
VSAELLYKDGLILVVNKPAGIASTPTARTPHLDLAALTFGKTTLPQVAHRLDKETTGCLVLGRHPRALRTLGELFQQRKIVKTYWAIVQGNWPAGLERVDEAIEGQEAATLITGRRECGGNTWLELRPLTGRTHQLRIHCATQGHPIVGDTRYGAQTPGTLLLHARRVEIPLHPKKAPVAVEAPLPASWPEWSEKS